MDLLLELSGRGKRHGLEEALRAAIRSGRLRSGATLPSTRELAAELGIARGTVVEAIDQLAVEGYVVKRQGTRTVVADLPEVAGSEQWVAPSRGWVHDLRAGSPEPGTFPVQEWLAAARRALRDTDDYSFGYGDPRGRFELRMVLAEYLARARGVRADPERILICAGVAHGLDLLGRALARSGSSTVAMEDPGMPFHRGILADTGLGPVACPVDDEGAVVPPAPADAVVLTPAHQYPTGVTMSSGRRHEVLAWARRCDAWVIEDDYDGEFRFDRRPVGALQGLDPERVVYAGTTSKALAPGCRIGWLVLPSELVEPVVRELRFRDPCSVFDQLALAELIRSGSFDRHIRRMRARYRTRAEELLGVLEAEAPGLVVGGGGAGLHLLVRFDLGLEDQFVECAAAQSLTVDRLGPHWHAMPGFEGAVIGFSRPPAHGFRGALDVLGAALRETLSR